MPSPVSPPVKQLTPRRRWTLKEKPAITTAPIRWRAMAALVHVPALHRSPSSLIACKSCNISLAVPPFVSTDMFSSSAPSRDATPVLSLLHGLSSRCRGRATPTAAGFNPCDTGHVGQQHPAGENYLQIRSLLAVRVKRSQLRPHLSTDLAAV